MEIEENDAELSIEELLLELKEDSDIRFQIELTKLIETKIQSEVELTKILCENKDVRVDLAYSAFVALCIYHRRYKNQTAHGLLFDSYRLFFNSYKSFPLFEALYYMSRGSLESLAAALHSIKQAVINLPNHNGVKAAYADIVAISYHLGAKNIDEEVDIAIGYINDAIKTDPSYAKYPFLRAKLALIQDDYLIAESNVRAAIDMEDSSRITYALRIGEYQKLELDISVKKAVRDIKSRISKIEEGENKAREEISRAVEDTKAQVLVQLSFFAGVLSIILTAVNMASSQNPDTAIIILIILGGIILSSWAGLSILVLRIQKTIPLLIVLISGLTMICLGILTYLRDEILKWITI